MGKRGRKPIDGAIEPRLLVTMREGCFYDRHPMEQTEAAALVGVSRNTWCMWECGHRGMAIAYVRRWLEVSAPYRIWEPIMSIHPHDPLLVVSVRYREAASAPAPEPIQMPPVSELMGPIERAEVAVPDASELERLTNETVPE
jgi:hypothetical protein